MVRDDVGKVNKNSLADPVCLVEALNHEPGEVKEVGLRGDSLDVGDALLGNELVYDCCIRLVVNFGLLVRHLSLYKMLIDLAALELGPAETADNLGIAVDGDEPFRLWPGCGFLTERAKIVTRVGQRLWRGLHIDLPTSRGGPAKAGSDHIQEGTVDAFSLKGPVPFGSPTDWIDVNGRRAVAEMELARCGSGRGKSWYPQT